MNLPTKEKVDSTWKSFAAWSTAFYPIVFLVCFLFLWHFLSQQLEIPTYLLPTPVMVWSAWFENKSELMLAFQQTAVNSSLGLVFAYLSAFLMSFVFIHVGWIRKAVIPYAVFFQTVPVIAIAPLLVIWFGFGARSVQVSAGLVAFFPLLTNILYGFERPTPSQLELFRLYRASNWQTFWRLRLPSSLPDQRIGLTVGSGLAVIGAIVGEFIAGTGLGSIIDAARTQQRPDLIFAALVLSSFLGLAFVLGIKFLQVLSRRPRR